MRQLITLALFVNYSVAVKLLPILFWHSAGETCCEGEFKSYASHLKAVLGKDVYIKSIRIGNNTKEDFLLSLVTHPFAQIKRVCEEIKSDEHFKHGFNGIGLSQGALFMRGLLQVCDGPPMRNLISLGGPQQGVVAYPQCEKYFGVLCDSMEATIQRVVYSADTQNAAAPATYWHDPEREDVYRGNSTFLALINNERILNQTYIERIKQLKRFVLVKFANDASIVPAESAHFGFVRGNQVVKLKDMDIYKEDRLGLRELDERGGLTFLESPGTHLELVGPWFAANVDGYLREPSQ